MRPTGRHSLVVDLPRVCSIMRHELQVLDPDGLVLQLGHGVIDTLLPGGNVVLLSRCGGWKLIPPQQNRIVLWNHPKLSLSFTFTEILYRQTECVFYLFMLRRSIGCRAANRSNSFLMISV